MLTFSIYALTTIFVIASVIMILAVLMQRPRSEGLGAAFGGGMTETLFGAGTTDILTKITIWLAGVFFVSTLVLAMLYSMRSKSEFDADALLQPDVVEEVVVGEEETLPDPSIEPEPVVVPDAPPAAE